MDVLLVDADSKIPNLALMKLSAYHRGLGNKVELLKLNIPYYPDRKKEEKPLPFWYDKIYCSVIFDNTILYIRKNQDIDFGGTGVSLKKELSEEIEELEPDYSIYPDNKISYGFITRGCIRKCPFCKVPEKEGYIHQVSTIDKIVRHSKVKFLDNNILSFPKHKEIFEELVEKQIHCQFNQGLDIRLIDKDNSKLLSELNYLGDYLFAFDDYKLESLIKEKLKFLSWRKDWQLKFFVYCSPEDSTAMQRVLFLKENKCLPYIMRDIKIWDCDNKSYFTDLAAWCNQPAFFKKMNFEEFCKRRHKKIGV